MPDRTHCQLTVYGRPTQDAYDALSKVCAPFTDEIDANSFSFPEMAYGQMPDEVVEALSEIDVAYIWDISADYGTPPKWNYRLADGSEGSFATSEGEVVLSLVQMENKEILKRAKDVTAMSAENDFRIVGDTSVTLSYREHATMLAALRFWQRSGLGDGTRDLVDGLPYHQRDIATDDGTLDPLTVEEIDALCERIN
ncbi:hypothetical protein A8B82_15165 [Sulfitobacter sp. EhC04]|uniref:hypothetical protein n=1 Tax=Sulfitobacter sp. EhC04 TaxID=1849168 RepID=UPI0007F4E464|nr:hypothetical protein [Sulfitobacter sp. EhC04]OAN76732.1 hypothetical protein A8B82_15165 [Sulfitobacter sp. EhC04]